MPSNAKVAVKGCVVCWLTPPRVGEPKSKGKAHVEYDGQHWRVECDECGSKACYWHTREEAVTHWNEPMLAVEQRDELAALRAELEEARGLIDDIDSCVPELFEVYADLDEVNEDAPLPLVERVQSLVDDRDALQAKLAEAERERDSLQIRNERQVGDYKRLDRANLLRHCEVQEAESQRDRAVELLRAWKGATEAILRRADTLPPQIRRAAMDTAIFLAAAPAGECAKCKTCDGMGELYAVDAGPCRECSGTGLIAAAQQREGGE